MQDWGRYTEAMGAWPAVWWVPEQRLTGDHLDFLSLGQVGKWSGIGRAWRCVYFPTDRHICQCFNEQHSCSGVYHLNISPGLTITEEPIMCFHEVLWRGLDVSQDLDLGIRVVPRLRSNNVFRALAGTGISIIPLQPSKAPLMHPSGPLWEEEKVMVIRKKTTFSYAVLLRHKSFPNKLY